jgi:hypothetical protein
MKKVLFITLMAMAIIGSYAQVHVDYDKQINFKKYKTFRFEPGKVIRNLGLKDTSTVFLNKYIGEAITRKLAEKGMSPAATHPDLVITYLAGAREKQDIQNYVSNPGYLYPYSRFYGFSGWWGPQWNNFWVRKYEEGTVIIDVYDVKTNELVWRSFAVSSINNFNEQKFVEKEIKKSFRHFPPLN